MGVSGTGKSSVAAVLAERLDLDFVEGDEHHPDRNIATMREGIPLTDEDRWPWLETLADLARQRLEAGHSLVLTCSALKRSYRDVLRSGVPDGRMFFVHLHAQVDVLAGRMEQRTKHFMPTSLLTSQLETLEPLEDDEQGAVVDVTPSVDRVADAAVAALERSPCGSRAGQRDGGSPGAAS